MMKRFLFHPFSFVALLLVIMLGAWITYFPVLVSGRFAKNFAAKIGRTVEVQNGAGYVFSPVFGIGLNDVSFAGASALAEPVVKAKQLIIPITFGQILSGQFSNDALILDNADIAVAINAQGHSNVLIELNPTAEKTDADAVVAQPIAVKLLNSRFHFSDERTTSTFKLEQVSGGAQFFDDGSLTWRGTAALNSQFITIDATLGSIARSFAEGSPLDLNIDGVASALAFSGRIATTNSLNLAGTADLSSQDAPRLLRWLGADIKGLNDNKILTLSGPLESNGAVFNFKTAALTYASMQAKGDISFAAGKLRPRISANLAFNTLNFDVYKTNSLKGGSGWDERPFNLEDLGTVDAEFSVSTSVLKYNGLKLGPSTLEGSLKDQVLDLTLQGEAQSGGSVKIAVALDPLQNPAKFNLNLDLNRVEAKEILGGLFDTKFISGPLTLTSTLNSSGASQAALISNLSGTVNAAIENGALSGVDLRNTLASISTNPTEGWAGETTPIVRAKLAATVLEGVATLGDNQFQGSGLSFQSTGEIDLLRQSLDLSVVPKTLSPISISGPWSKPKIGLK